MHLDADEKDKSGQRSGSDKDSKRDPSLPWTSEEDSDVEEGSSSKKAPVW